MKTITACIFIICFGVLAAIKDSQTLTMELLQSCIDQELAQCPDKLCEMSSDDNYPIVQQAFENLKACIDDKTKGVVINDSYRKEKRDISAKRRP